MNHKGQTLVVFVLLLPLLFVLFAYLVDQGEIYYTQNHMKSLASSIGVKKKEAFEQELLENDSMIRLLSYQENKETIVVVLQKKVKSIFGNILGIKEYKVNVKEKLEK